MHFLQPQCYETGNQLQEKKQQKIQILEYKHYDTEKPLKKSKRKAKDS